MQDGQRVAPQQAGKRAKSVGREEFVPVLDGQGRDVGIRHQVRAFPPHIEWLRC